MWAAFNTCTFPKLADRPIIVTKCGMIYINMIVAMVTGFGDLCDVNFDLFMPKSWQEKAALEGENGGGQDSNQIIIDELNI